MNKKETDRKNYEKELIHHIEQICIVSKLTETLFI